MVLVMEWIQCNSFLRLTRSDVDLRRPGFWPTPLGEPFECLSNSSRLRDYCTR